MIHVTSTLIQRHVVVAYFISMFRYPPSLIRIVEISNVKTKSPKHKSRIPISMQLFQAFKRVFLKHGFHPMSNMKADKHEPLRFTISINDIILSKCSPKRTTCPRGPLQKHSCEEIHLIHSILIYILCDMVPSPPPSNGCMLLKFRCRAIKHLRIFRVWLAFCCVGGSLGCSCINVIVVLGLRGVH